MHIANTIQGTSTPIDDVRPFDPAAWLARYVELGAGYTVRDSNVWLGWSMDVPKDRQAEICAHIRLLRHDLEKHQAIKTLLIATQAGRV